MSEVHENSLPLSLEQVASRAPARLYTNPLKRCPGSRQAMCGQREANRRARFRLPTGTALHGRWRIPAHLGLSVGDAVRHRRIIFNGRVGSRAVLVSGASGGEGNTGGLALIEHWDGIAGT